MIEGNLFDLPKDLKRKALKERLLYLITDPDTILVFGMIGVAIGYVILLSKYVTLGV